MPKMFPLRRFGRRELRSIAEFGKWQGGAHFVGAVGNQVDRYVLGVFAPLSVVGQYNVAMRLQEVVHMGLLKATEVLFPHFTVTASDPVERRASFFIQASWILNVLGVAALAPLIPLAGDLLTPLGQQGNSQWWRADAAHTGCRWHFGLRRQCLLLFRPRYRPERPNREPDRCPCLSNDCLHLHCYQELWTGGCWRRLLGR